MAPEQNSDAARVIGKPGTLARRGLEAARARWGMEAHTWYGAAFGMQPLNARFIGKPRVIYRSSITYCITTCLPLTGPLCFNDRIPQYYRAYAVAYSWVFTAVLYFCCFAFLAGGAQNSRSASAGAITTGLSTASAAIG